MKNVRSASASVKNIRVLTVMAMLASLSIVFGKLLAFTAGPFRISFENLPILMAGMFLGAPAGFLTGVIADIIGCLIVGYSINPIITLGAGCIGLLSGLLFRRLPDIPLPHMPAGLFGNWLTVILTHAVGSMLIKSVGLILYYHYALPQVALRIPLYLVIGTVEALIITALLSNPSFAAQIERLGRK